MRVAVLTPARAQLARADVTAVCSRAQLAPADVTREMGCGASRVEPQPGKASAKAPPPSFAALIDAGTVLPDEHDGPYALGSYHRNVTGRHRGYPLGRLGDRTSHAPGLRGGPTSGAAPLRIIKSLFRAGFCVIPSSIGIAPTLEPS
jgi:hypothetical protein